MIEMEMTKDTEHYLISKEFDNNSVDGCQWKTTINL